MPLQSCKIRCECSIPKSYVTVLSDGRVWKRHVDHLRQKELNSEELPSQTAKQNDPIPLTNNFMTMLPYRKMKVNWLIQ